MTQHEKLDLILENQKSLMKELGFIEELLKALIINNTLDSAEKLAQTEKTDTIKSIECRLENLEKSQNDNIDLIMQKLNSFSENNNNSQNNEFKKSSEEHHKSQIGRKVKISNSCDHYFDVNSHYLELPPYSRHRKRTWTINAYGMDKYLLYWTNGQHTFELWLDTNDVVF